MKKYALVLTADANYLPGATAIFNGLQLYGNTDIDVHFIPTPDVPQDYLLQLPADQFTVVPWESLPVGRVASDPTRGLPWQVRFFRYWYAATICKDYQALMIIDADSMVVGDITSAFEQAAANQQLLMVRNPMGLAPDFPPELFTRATQPTFHSHCATYPAIYQRVLSDVFEWGMTNPYGDMVAVHRVLCKSSQDFSKIHALPNEQWCHTRWWDQPVARYTVGGLPVLQTYDDQRMSVVHGKWWNPDYLDKECERASHSGDMSAFYGVDKDGRRNAQLYHDVYDWLNKNGVYRAPVGTSVVEEQ